MYTTAKGRAMTTTDIPTLDHVRTLAARLPRQARAELIAWLALDLAAPVPSVDAPLTPRQARDAWAALRDELSALPQGPTTMAEQLDRDRQERDSVLMGTSSDVYS
jgi:hypothetical protein